jgi:voltage-gated potassium channel
VNNERRALVGALLLMICLLLFASTGIYFAEHKAQPDEFGSVPASMWWAISTLTTVGYGDVTPITMFGRIFGGLVMIFGLGMFALPIGIMATGFSQETNRREFVVSWNLVANVPMFARLDASEIARLLPVLNSVTFGAGEMIMHEGDTAAAMYFIASGKVEIETANEPVILSEGGYFGEMALLENRPRGHTVRAATKCRLLMLESPDFHRLMRGHPELLAAIRELAEERRQ